MYVVVSGNTEIEVNETLQLSFVYYKKNYAMPPELTSIPIITTVGTIDTSEEGYYLLECVGEDRFGGSTYTLEFGVLIKVGNPTGEYIPEIHFHYNYDTSWLDQLVSYSEIEYSGSTPNENVLNAFIYDNQGNPITISDYLYDGNLDGTPETYNATLEWDGSQLTKIRFFDKITGVPKYSITYTYNDKGYRIGKEFTDYYGSNDFAITYKRSGGRVIYESDGVYAIIYSYDYDGQLIGFTYDPNINISNNEEDYFYIRNQMGDITSVIDDQGNIIVHYTYDVYGSFLDIETTSGYEYIYYHNIYTYRGYETDLETNMFLISNRFYNSNYNRFISANSISSTLNNDDIYNMYKFELQLNTPSFGNFANNITNNQTFDLDIEMPYPDANYKSIAYNAFKDYNSNYTGHTYANNAVGLAFSLTPALTSLGKTGTVSGQSIAIHLVNSYVFLIFIFYESAVAYQHYHKLDISQQAQSYAYGLEIGNIAFSYLGSLIMAYIMAQLMILIIKGIGAAIGTAICPLIGTFIGSMIGGFVGYMIADSIYDDLMRGVYE